MAKPFIMFGHQGARDLVSLMPSIPTRPRFFERKLHYYPDEDPKLPYVRPNFEEIVGEAEQDDAIDRLLQASGAPLPLTPTPPLHELLRQY